MSMLVRRSGMLPLLLVGDLTYDVHALERGQTGGVGSRRQLRETRDQVLALPENNPGMQILAAHDPAAPPSSTPPNRWPRDRKIHARR